MSRSIIRYFVQFMGKHVHKCAHVSHSDSVHKCVCERVYGCGCDLLLLLLFLLMMMMTMMMLLLQKLCVQVYLD